MYQEILYLSDDQFSVLAVTANLKYIARLTSFKESRERTANYRKNK